MSEYLPDGINTDWCMYANGVSLIIIIKIKINLFTNAFIKKVNLTIYKQKIIIKVTYYLVDSMMRTFCMCI